MARMTLDQLVTQLRAAFGPALKSVVLYGSAVAGEHLAKRSDYNVLLIVDILPAETLRAAAAVAGAWSAAGNPPPLIFTEEEWRTSADVFPMEYADILERHRVLHGDPPFAGISVDREHLRLQVEQEARGKLLHLRQAVFGASANPRAQIELLETTLSKLMVLFRGVIRLHGETPPTDYEALAGAVAATSGIDPAALVSVVKHLRGERKIGSSEAGGVLDSYLRSIENLVRYLDKYGKNARTT